MPAKTKPDKKKVKKLEKEIKEGDTIWSKITRIHKKDKWFLSSLQNLLMKKPKKRK